MEAKDKAWNPGDYVAWLLNQRNSALEEAAKDLQAKIDAIRKEQAEIRKAMLGGTE
jgi:hypothetical protein